MSKAALLVVDLINEVVHPEGKFYHGVDFEPVIAKANRAIQYCRRQQIPIYFVKVGFSADYAELPLHSPLFSAVKQNRALLLGEWSTEFAKDLDYKTDDIVIVKHRVSCFYATKLEALLRAQQIDTIILAGASTDMAIQTTAREAHDRDYRAVVLSDATTSMKKGYHDITLEQLERVATVIRVDKMNEI